MGFNYITLFSIYITFLLVIRHASCSPAKFLFPSKPSINASSSSTPLSLPPSSITSLVDKLKNNHLNIPEKVIEACKKTDFPSECSSSVVPMLLDGQYEPLDILQGEAKALTQALEVAREDTTSNNWNEINNKQIVLTCKEMYENAKDEISKAMELVARNDKYGVNVYFSGALTYIETCKDELPKNIKVDSIIVLANKLLSNLATNCLALGNFVMGLQVVKH